MSREGQGPRGPRGGAGKGGQGGQGPRRGGSQGKPSRGASDRPGRGGERRGGGQGKPERGGSGRPDRSGGRGDKRDFSRPRPGGRDRAREVERTETQQRYDGPELPDSITGKELDRAVASALKSLPEKLALRVSRHLVAAGQLLDTDPKTAYEHTLAARSRAGRLAVVREAVGEAAYAAGDFEEALAELRAAKRMNGSLHYIPMMADCHRALGRPDKALALARETDRAKLAPELAAELVIVEAGARRDRGELDAALRTLEHAPLMSKARASWVVRLRYMYADTLVEAGREADAIVWFHRADAIDSEQTSDAAERAADLERRA